MRSFHWFRLYFVPKVRKYLDSKGLPSKVLFILDNALIHPEPCEFNTEVFYLPPNTASLIQLLDQGVWGLLRLITHSILWEGLSILWKKTLIERTTWKSGRIISLKMPSWHYRKVWANQQSETINSCWRKLHPDVVHDFTELLQSRWRKLWRDCGCGQKKGGEEVKSLKIWILKKFKSL